MANSRHSKFEQCALAAGLLTEAQLDEARTHLRWASGSKPDPEATTTDQQLAERLVEMGLLNRWQAKQLLDGRTKFSLGAYQIVDSLGKGGMGQVFKGEHSITGRTVAIKVLPRDKCTPQSIESFNREIEAQAKLDHPQLVRALDAGYDGSVYYLVTEYVPGGDLRKLVRHSGPLGMELAASIISQAAQALQHAHEQGIVHRDVKPGNVLVTPEGQAKLSDLGLAGPLARSELESDPRYGKIVGTADYLAPDHITTPWNPTPSWDVYSLGCTLYYAVTGKVPFPGGTTADKARAHCELRPLDPRRLNPALSSEFVDVLADMMAKEPSERVASAEEVVRRLAPWTVRAVAMKHWPNTGRPRGHGGVVPPPVAPPVQRPAGASSGAVAVAPVAASSDTITDFPTNGTEPESESEGSLSLIVATNHRWGWREWSLLGGAVAGGLLVLVLGTAALLKLW